MATTTQAIDPTRTTTPHPVRAQPIAAMFDDYAQAKRAVGRLEVLGVPAADISIVGNYRQAHPLDSLIESDTDHAIASTSHEGVGAVTGGVLGGAAGVLAGIGIFTVPGIGPLVAAGWLASAIVGAAAGASAGALIGGLTSTGIPDDHAHIYAEGIRRGATLVTARVDPRLVPKVTEILEAEGHIDIHERAATWHSEGWNGRYTGIGS